MPDAIYDNNCSLQFYSSEQNLISSSKLFIQLHSGSHPIVKLKHAEQNHASKTTIRIQ